MSDTAKIQRELGMLIAFVRDCKTIGAAIDPQILARIAKLDELIKEQTDVSE